MFVTKTILAKSITIKNEAAKKGQTFPQLMHCGSLCCFIKAMNNPMSTTGNLLYCQRL